MRTKKILLFGLLYFSSIFFAQKPFLNFTVKTISQDDGLSQGSNYFRFEDRHGFMWITGNDALNRYDGDNVKVYNLTYFFNHCPTLQQGYGFAEDENHLYVGSTRGLFVYNYDKDTFTLIEIYKNIKTKTAIPIGFAKGKIWCFNENYQLASFDPKSKVTKIEAQVPLETIKSVHVYDNEGNLFYYRMPFIDIRGNICFIGKQKIVVYHLKTKKFEDITPKIKDEQNLEFLTSCYIKETDELFIGTLNNGVFILKSNFNDFESLNTKIQTIGSLAANKNYVAYGFDVDFYLYNRLLKTKQRIPQLDLANGCYFDKIGRLWICRDGFGQKIVNFNGSILKNSNDFDAKEISFKSGVGEFVETFDKKVIIQTKIIFDASQKKYDVYQNSLSKLYKDPYRDCFWGLDRIWENQTNLFQIDKKGSQKKVLTIQKSEYGLFQDIKPFEYAAMFSFSNGLYWLNLKNKTFDKITSLPDKNPFYINKISQNRVAISYLNGDMILAEVKSDGSVKFLRKFLPNVQSFYLQEDVKNQQYWVGSNEGVFLLDQNFKILRKFDSNNGLAGTYIYGLLIDDFGKIWCSHQRGLSSIDTKSYKIINFGKEDGIQHWDFNNRSFLKASDGTLYFGGVNGFNYFKPPLQFNNYYHPEIYFDEILVNNTRLSTKNGYNLIHQLQLKHDENSISIKVLIKDLENASQYNLYYRVTNTDNIWKIIPKKTPFLLNSLAPDLYKIEFGLNNKFSNEILVYKKLEIQIQKAFYQTFWFWAVIGGLFFGSVIYLYSRWKFLKTQNKLRERLTLENERNKITADLHDDIGATLSSLQINSSIAVRLIEKNKTEEAQQILKSIESQSQKLSENISDIVWSLRPTKEALMTLNTRIRNSANEILGSTDIFYQIELEELLNDEITDFVDRKNIVLIVKEALNNIVKYSKAKKVNLSFKKKNKEYILEIKDDGIGFVLDYKKGNGLQNMKKRAEEMKGIFEIISENGTLIKIRIPNIRD